MVRAIGLDFAPDTGYLSDQGRKIWKKELRRKLP
jgi:hypothetical protein